MMNTLIIYDSTFGNTEQLARAMANRLGDYGMVILFRVPEAGALEIKDADVLIDGQRRRRCNTIGIPGRRAVQRHCGGRAGSHHVHQPRR